MNDHWRYGNLRGPLIKTLSSIIHCLSFSKQKRRREKILILSSGLFDAKYYLSRYPDVANANINPLEHYLADGAQEGRDPSPYFSTQWYINNYPIVLRKKVNPLAHFAQCFNTEYTKPNQYFDTKWYLENYNDQMPVGINPLFHYINTGHKRGLMPFKEFDPKFYLSHNSDVRNSKMEPFLHYLLHGAKENRNADPSYSSWIRLYDTITADDLQRIGQHINAFQQKPLFSFFSLYDHQQPSRTKILIKELQSQAYANWELILGVPESTSYPDSIDSFLVPKQPNIRTLRLPKSSQKTWHQELFLEAKGDFLSFVPHGILLREHTLFALANEINDYPNTSIIYSDHDYTNAQGQRINPNFKPDWDPELLSETDYVGDFFSFKRELLSGLKPEDYCSQWELLLLISSNTKSENIRHIHSVLYSYTPDFEKQAFRVDERIQMLDRWAMAKGLPISTIKRGNEIVTFLPQPPSPPPLVSIIIPTKNKLGLLKQCLESILHNTSWPNYEILVIDNNSDEAETLNYLSSLQKDNHIRVLSYKADFNYSAINNFAAREARGDVLCLLNNDTQVIDENWLEYLVQHSLRKEIGCVSPKLLYPDRTVQHAGVILGPRGMACHCFQHLHENDGGYMNRANHRQTFSALSAACLIIRKDTYQFVNGFDEKHLGIAFNDIDFCLKVRQAGFRNIYVPDAKLIHHESATRGQDSSCMEKQLRCSTEALCIKSRWAAAVYSDPAYNPNLSFIDEPFSLAFPPRIDVPWKEPSYQREGFTSQDREPRLDIYGSSSNEARVRQSLASYLHPQSFTEGSPGLSVIILTKDHPELIIPLCKQLSEQQAAFISSSHGYEVIIGDTGSSSQEVLSFYNNHSSTLRIFRNLKYNFSSNNNQLEREAKYDTLLFLNNDIILPQDLSLLLHAYNSLKQDISLSCLGSVMFYPDGKLQHAGCEFIREPSAWGLPYHLWHRQTVDLKQIEGKNIYPSVTGAFLLVKRRLFQLAGGFDEGYKAECQDTALCLELHRLGYSSACQYLGHIIHIENASRPKNEENWPDRQRFLRKYGSYIRSAFLNSVGGIQ